MLFVEYKNFNCKWNGTGMLMCGWTSSSPVCAKFAKDMTINILMTSAYVEKYLAYCHAGVEHVLQSLLYMWPAQGLKLAHETVARS